MNNKSVSLIILSSLASLLTACGGGSSTDKPNNDPSNPVTIAQPTVITNDNWLGARTIQVENSMNNSVQVIGSELVVNVVSDDISEGNHLQIYLNTDNTAETGFQFDNQAWVDSGVDYLIEDGDLFKSTANNTGWNWNVNAGAIGYSVNGNSVNANIDLSLLGDICNNIKVGVMTRDESWDISTFSPASAQMQTYNVQYCNTETPDTVKPEMSLLGANPLILNMGNELVDPGATALDDVDGDISNSITSLSTVDHTVAGSYSITYTVADTAGNTSEISRMVIVEEDTSTEGIVIDGNINDWNNIPALSSSADAVMKVFDDEEKIYILVTSSNLGDNIQVLMDTDNKEATGLNLSSQINTWLAGADHMIENNSLDKSLSNTGWSWDYGISPIEYIKTSDALEIAIKKSDIEALADQIPMGYVSRTESWNVNYILPEQALPIYTLEFPVTAPNVKPIAQDDSATTPEDIAVTLDVLGNDTTNSGSGALTISSVSSPSYGTVTLDNGEIVYTPDTGFSGIDSFTYTITDSNGETATATVTITVTASPNNPPTATNDSATTLQNQSVTLSVLDNDKDPDNDLLSIISINTLGGDGIATIVDNKILFTPPIGLVGLNDVRYTISDGNGGTDTATVTITIVGIVPNAVNDTIATLQNQEITIPVLNNDTPTESPSLAIFFVSNPNNGTAEIVNNKILYTPFNDFLGIDSFNYRITNSGAGETDSATVTVSVTAPPNNTPIANNDSTTTVGINTARIAVLTNDTDEDGDTLQITGFTSPSNGSITLSTATATFNYTPNATFSGIDTFTYTIRDGNGGIATATVSITVPENNAPDAVEDVASVYYNQTITVDVLANDTDPDGDTLRIVPESVFAITEGITATLNPDGTILVNPQGTVASLSVSYTVTDGRGASDTAVLTLASTNPDDGNVSFPTVSNEFVTTPINTSIFVDVLANDFDSDGDTLSIDMVDDPANGTTQKVTQNGIAGILYTPDPGFEGIDIFYYGVPDGRGNNGSGFVQVTVGTPVAVD